ncbi:MAG: SDR family NAD(P)-dependent oxidoreductase [Candidatus Tectimicrobiota bacterium]
MKALHDHIAVVTGAGSGIGQAMALALAAQGATLCLVGRTPATLQVTASRAAQGSMYCYPADLRQDEAVQTLATQLQHDWHTIDILVHSAGVYAMGPLDTTPVATLDQQYQTNVRAPYLLTQALLPLLRPRQGQVVFLNSSVGLTARGTVGAYAASKHALKAIADSLREEVNATGLRVLSVYLGRTASPMQATIHALEGKPYHPEDLLQPYDVAMVTLQALLLPRTAEVTDITIRPMRKPPQG